MRLLLTALCWFTSSYVCFFSGAFCAYELTFSSFFSFYRLACVTPCFNYFTFVFTFVIKPFEGLNDGML